MKNLTHIALLFSVFLLVGCSNDSESDLMENQDPPTTGEKVTYNANISSVMSNNCVSCHKSPPVNGAPFALTTYEEVKAIAENGSLMTAISKQSGESLAMPPSGRLPQATIDLVQKWIDDGLLEE